MVRLICRGKDGFNHMVPTLKLLAQKFRVYAPDLPGFGASEKPARALDVAGLSEVLAGWMRAAGLGRAVLVGNSMGCQVITELAVRYPGLVERVVLQGPTMDRRGRGAFRHVGRLLVDVFREPPSLLALEAFDLLRAGVVRSWRTFRYALEDPIEERLPRVDLPALVVHGSRDPISPRPWAEEVARLLPRGRLVVLPGAAHAVNYSAAAGFVQEIRAFLDARNENPEPFVWTETADAIVANIERFAHRTLPKHSADKALPK